MFINSRRHGEMGIGETATCFEPSIRGHALPSQLRLSTVAVEDYGPSYPKLTFLPYSSGPCIVDHKLCFNPWKGWPV